MQTLPAFRRQTEGNERNFMPWNNQSGGGGGPWGGGGDNGGGPWGQGPRGPAARRAPLPISRTSSAAARTG